MATSSLVESFDSASGVQSASPAHLGGLVIKIDTKMIFDNI